MLWELQRLRAARTQLVPIGHVPELRAVLGVADPHDPWAGRLRHVLDGEEVLGYTMTWRGRRRFARALRATLLCPSSSGPVALPGPPVARPSTR